MTPDEASAKLAELDQILKGINDHINQLLANRLVSALPIVPLILKAIHNSVANISHVIESIVGHIVAQVASSISNLLPGPIDFLLGISNNIFNDVHSILGNLATADEFVSGAINAVLQQAGPLGTFVTGAVGAAISGGITDVLQFLEGQDKATIDHFLDDALKAIPKDHWLYTMVHGLRQRGAEWQALALPLLVGVMLQPIGVAMADPLIKDIAYASNRTFMTEVLSPETLVELRLKAVITTAEYHEMMARNNFSPQRADEMVDARRERLLPEQVATLSFRGQISDERMYNETFQRGITTDRMDFIKASLRPLLSPEEIRDTYRRGIIDEPKHDALLRQHGFTDDAIARKKTLYWLIPPPDDLIHMAIRNVFNPEIVARFQLFGDFPPPFEAAARQQGISREWAERYWGAHWIVPSNQEGFEMFHRTTERSLDEHADTFTLSDGTKVQNVIGLTTLQLLLREKDTAPFYRAKLTEIAYSPFTRIDVRRMFSVGSLDKAGVERAYLNLGYSPPNALQLANFVEKFYSQARKDKAQPLIDSLRREALRLYVQDKLSLEQVGFILTDMGFTESETRYLIAEADLLRHAEIAKKVETGVGRLYVNSFITEDDARKRLTTALVPQEAIDAFINGWNLDREFKADSEHFHKQRDLTKSEASQAFAEGLMSEADLLSFMEFLGYPEAEAQIEVAHAKYQQGKSLRTATEEALKALYVNGIQDEPTTSNALDALLLPASRRDALLSTWRLQRETRTERIPIATLRDMVKAQFLAIDEAFPHLKRHRFTDDDANLLLDFWQQQPQPTRRKRGPITGG